MLRYFIHGYLNAHSIYPTNIFKIRSILCILELNIDFWHFVNKPSWHRELHMQQGKHIPNLQYIVYYLFPFSLHMCELVHILFVDLPTLNYLMCLENSLIFRKVRSHTPKRENWLVAWSQSLRMLHQGTCGRMNLQHKCKKQDCQVFYLTTWFAALTWSVWMLECHGKGRNGLWAGTKHLIFYLPFGCILDWNLIPKIVSKLYPFQRLL